MKTLMKKLVLGAALGASIVGAAAPAEAQRYRYHNRDRGSTAVVAGIAGLAIGAALVANNNNNRYERDRWYRDNGYRYDYDDYYYRQRGYYPTNGYYAERYRDYDRCFTERRYDPYYGRSVKVRVCN